MLNIKNKETYKLAQELSNITGKSMTTLVTEALREKLDIEKVRNYKKKHKIADELIKIAQRIIKSNQPNQTENQQNKETSYDS